MQFVWAFYLFKHNQHGYYTLVVVVNKIASYNSTNIIDEFRIYNRHLEFGLKLAKCTCFSNILTKNCNYCFLVVQSQKRIFFCLENFP